MNHADLEARMSRFALRFPRDFLLSFDEPPDRPFAVQPVSTGPTGLQMDPVIRFGEPLEELLHFKFIAGDLEGHSGHLLACNASLFFEFGVPVHTLAVLFQADNPGMFEGGQVHYSARPGRGSMFFHFETVAIADRLVEDFLGGPPGTLPLAVLAKLPVAGDEVNGIQWIGQHIRDRCQGKIAQEDTLAILDLARELSCLRIPREDAERIFPR